MLHNNPGVCKTLERVSIYQFARSHDGQLMRFSRSIQERRNTLAKQKQALSMAMQEGQRGLNELHQTIEANLQLGAHAETWEWKEVNNKP
jgi:hypothetical protein